MIERVNIPPRTEDGIKGLVFPQNEDFEEVRLCFQGCKNCPKQEAHSSPAYDITYRNQHNGKFKHFLDNPQHRIEARTAHQIFAKLWLRHYVLYGVQKGTLFNLGQGTASNISNQVRYEILSTSGKTMVLRGRNPWKLGFPISKLNPEWPLVPGRLLSEVGYIHLPLGSEVNFAPPSVLYEKLKPFITKVIPPESRTEDEVEFNIEVSHSVNFARTPYDAKYPPADGKYYCEIFFYGQSPIAVPNFQKKEQATFAWKNLYINREQLDALENTWMNLNDKEGNPCRILYPNMGQNCFILIIYKIGQNPMRMSDEIAKTYLRTVDLEGGGWRTDINLVFEKIDPTVFAVQIIYMPESTEGEEFLFLHQSSCSNSQIDYSGSYKDGVNNYCTNKSCSHYKEGKFKDQCWNPNATGFAIGDETNFVGQLGFPTPSDIQNQKYLSDIWSRSSFTFNQGMPSISSHRNFYYERPVDGGFSIQEMTGAYQDFVFGGFFAKKQNLFFPMLGKPRDYRDDDDQELIDFETGLFEKQRTRIDGTVIPLDGNIFDIVNFDDQEYNDRSNRLDAFPSLGPASFSVYDAAKKNGTLNKRARKSEDFCEFYAIDISTNFVDSDFNTQIRNIFE